MVEFNLTIPVDGIYGVEVRDGTTDELLGMMSVELVAGQQIRVKPFGETGFIKSHPNQDK